MGREPPNIKSLTRSPAGQRTRELMGSWTRPHVDEFSRDAQFPMIFTNVDLSRDLPAFPFIWTWNVPGWLLWMFGWLPLLTSYSILPHWGKERPFVDMMLVLSLEHVI